VSDRTSVLALSFAMLALAAAATATKAGMASPDAELSFWRLGPSGHQRFEQIVHKRLDALPPPAEFEPLSHAFMRQNVVGPGSTVGASTGRPGAGAGQGLGQAADAARQFGARLAIFLKEKKAPSYMAVGAYLSSQLRVRLESTMVRMAVSGLSAAEWLAANSTSKDVVELRSLAGNFLERAIASGLIKQGTAPDSDTMDVAQALWMEHWMALASGRLGTDVTVFERAVVLKWKVEAAEHLPPDRKLVLLDELAGLDAGYPSHYVRGVLQFAAGRTSAALESFRASLASEPVFDRAASWVVFLRDAER